MIREFGDHFTIFVGMVGRDDKKTVVDLLGNGISFYLITSDCGMGSQQVVVMGSSVGRASLLPAVQSKLLTVYCHLPEGSAIPDYLPSCEKICYNDSTLREDEDRFNSKYY